MRMFASFLCAAAVLISAGANPASAQFNLDNYKCYKVKDLKNEKFVKTSVTLTDQFGINDGVFEAKKPFLFCNPVDKNGEGILNADDHLTCYKAKGPKLSPSMRPSVSIMNQIGPLQLQAKKAFLLCLPSTKTVI